MNWGRGGRGARSHTDTLACLLPEGQELGVRSHRPSRSVNLRHRLPGGPSRWTSQLPTGPRAPVRAAWPLHSPAPAGSRCFRKSAGVCHAWGGSHSTSGHRHGGAAGLRRSARRWTRAVKRKSQVQHTHLSQSVRYVDSTSCTPSRPRYHPL